MPDVCFDSWEKTHYVDKDHNVIHVRFINDAPVRECVRVVDEFIVRMMSCCTE